MEKKQFSPFSLSKRYWRFCVSQAPRDSGRVFNQCLVGETKDQDHLCSSRAGPTDVHCDLPCQVRRQHLSQHQEASLAQGTGHGMAQQNWRSQCSKALVFPWSSADGSSLGARPSTKSAPSSKSKGTFVLQENTLPTTPNKL